MGIARITFLLLIGIAITKCATLPGRDQATTTALENGKGERIARNIATVKEEHKRICGNKDQPAEIIKRKKRFIPRGLYWHKKNLTWRLKNYTPHLNPTETLSQIKSAFNEWARYSALTFKQIEKGKADIEISFEPKRHILFGNIYCNLEFDGPGGTIGHAFYPMRHAAYAGNIHLDGDENFSVDGNNGFNFGSAILHEIGHSLGLLHSDTYYSIMHPAYAMQAKGKYVPLTVDDVDGIQSIYGHPKEKGQDENSMKMQNAVEDGGQSDTKTVSKIIPTTIPKELPVETVSNTVNGIEDNDVQEKPPQNQVIDNKVDILPVATEEPAEQRTTGFTKSPSAAKTNEETRSRTKTTRMLKPTTTATTKQKTEMQPATNQSKDVESSSLDRKPKCPETIDAIFVSKFNSKTYVFNGLFMYSLGAWLGYDKDSYYTRNRYLFSKIDAVYRTKEDGKLILFSGQLYAVYRDDVILEKYGAIYDFGFPYEIKEIDAAVIFGPYKNTYFFTGEDYWRYNVTTKRMDPGYPKKISSVWKGVPSNVDAAITWKNGLTYFFKGKNYYRLHTYTATVEYGYPKAIDDVWIRC